MTTTLWVKICGLSTAEAVSAAVLGGADAVGFVLAPGSPRTVSPEAASALAALVPDGVESVGVFRGQTAVEVIASARTAGVQTVQLHGGEAPDVFDAVRSAGFGVIRATSAETYGLEAQEHRELYGDARLLLDAPDPGAGETFDADALTGVEPPSGWILAGGLRPGNVAALAEALRPGGVDVSSGVEIARGVKDPELIREFLAAARA
ncbi:phosphoribosylanthranilate isomerase [Frondihabitans australicus]|uniref:N-(5'-phosphoribosyl)anthranilate isomerase n=1 Tax=Frondihabitans australicus TaxID=386892 RepID=A0A495IJI0_9MICO|nr:phosphoribosylanthranilate isomerase [Frondihabitans australicus]RKR76134.1 phosphoribosylanthranilate isomerase [Frondihabitans australicus]